jgi:two-component system KDP operon response regulator KdpE
VTRVLVVDDEPQIVRALRINLRVRGYDVDVAASGGQALELAARHPPDLVILDLGLPDLDGVEVIAGLRGWTSVPIIVLSGRADSADKVEALDAGADDYVTKPFGMAELLARMRAATRRVTPAEDTPQVRLGGLTVDLVAKRVIRPGGADVRLTPTEWHLLEALARHPGRLLTHRQLLQEVWGPGYADATGNLRLYMAQLRRKLEPDPARPRCLLTEPGMGYRFQPDPAGRSERGPHASQHRPEAPERGPGRADPGPVPEAPLPLPAGLPAWGLDRARRACPGQPGIGGDQRAAKFFGQRHVQAVEHPDPVPQGQGPLQMGSGGGHQALRQRGRLPQGPGRRGGAESAVADQAGQRRQQLSRLVAGRADLLAVDPVQHPRRRGLVKNHVREGGGVQHDHWPNPSRTEPSSAVVSTR